MKAITITPVAAAILLGVFFADGALAAAEDSPLVSADELEAIACSPDVVVLDIRSMKIDGQSREDYARGHVPCAVHSDYIKAGWRAKMDGVPGMLPAVDKLQSLIGGLGIGNDTHVVIAPLGADAKSMAAAARVYWTLQLLGHDRVSILDGGTLGYPEKDGRALEPGERAAEPTRFQARLREDMLVSPQDVADAAQRGAALVDYRQRAEFTGLNRNPRTVRAGTIAGAYNLPLDWLTRDNGGYVRSAETLGEIYAFLGIPRDADQIAFCNTGHNSSLGWFVAHELLGNERVRVYDGSMAQWSREESRPIVRVIGVTD
ncbi:MAG: hypothetical protein K9L70_06460 [Thiohalocapsa sp.]|nr:hypothetical protein [Thiohalocapsa sp.]MCF7992400.1 hypothetical protein [Thiohalocapsa sp.]